jgi:hypothetical protein
MSDEAYVAISLGHEKAPAKRVQGFQKVLSHEGREGAVTSLMIIVVCAVIIVLLGSLF